MKKTPIILWPVFAALIARADLTDYALPIVGTDNTPELSAGNLYPCIARPWGAHGWSPQTGDNETGWLYRYADRKIRGIRLTHQPSPWIGDYGQFSLLPTKALKKFDLESRASWFSHKTEYARPHLYRVYLADFDTTVEVTPTCNAAMIRATYPATDAPQFVIDAFSEGEILKAEGNVIEGVSRQAKVRWNETKRARPLENFFHITFDRPFVSVAREGTTIAVRFAPVTRGTQISARVAASFVSMEQARYNLREVTDKTFEQLVAEGSADWNRVLSRVYLYDEDLDRRRMFYTCLYRALLFPRRFYDIAPDGHPVHRSPHTLEVKPGRYYCDTGFWDTFRSLFPLLNFIYPEMNREMTEGLLNCYEEGGWLPEWSSPGYRHCMIGNNSASVVADAFLSGAAAGMDTNRLYAALLHGANNVHSTITSEGRLGFADYNAKGYVPRNVFDPAKGLACGRNADGSFDADFNPYKWGGDFTEGNALHYTWSVFHDVAALMEAMGGREKFAATLDAIFKLPPIFDASYYKTVVHEIREMQIMGFGQYAHGNQPIQHMPYLYDWCGEPWKTQKHVSEIVARLYRPTPDGYCGDEDNGQTSAWFVWSSLGFYPVCPGTQEYALGAPQVSSVQLTLGGRTLAIKAVGVDGQPATDFIATPYVERLTLNGKVVDRNYLTRDELVAGGELIFTLSPTPNRQRGISADAVPYSLSMQ